MGSSGSRLKWAASRREVGHKLEQAEEDVLTRWALIHHAIESPTPTEFAQDHVEVGAAVPLHLALLQAHAGWGQDTAHGKDDGQRDGNCLAHGTGICLMLADAEELMPLHLPRYSYILATSMPRQPLTPSPPATTSVSNCVRGDWDKLSAFSSSCESLLNSFNVSVHFSLTYANSPPLLWAYAKHANGAEWRAWCGHIPMRLC